MRLANVRGRAALITKDGAGAVDLAKASDDRLPSSMPKVFERFDEVRSFADSADMSGAKPFSRDELGAPSPRPRQVLAIGLNYRDHAAETKLPLPTELLVFTKFASCLAGPDAAVPHPGGELDWEVELVVIIGRAGRDIAAADSWSYVAGLCVGQDISERVLQHAGTNPQFSMGKSFEAFGPTGPWLVTPDELAAPDDLEIGCSLNGSVMQSSRTSAMVFSVTDIIVRLSRIVELLPGDVIFTGTPAGVGLARNPRHFMSVGDELVSHISGIGELRNRIVTGHGA